MPSRSRAAGVAIVTGAAGGMGTHCARLLAEDGWDELVLCDLDEARLAPIAGALRSAATRVEVVAGQITDPLFYDELLLKVGGRGIGAIIHTAGISPHMGSAEKILAVNLDATQLLVDAIFPHMSDGAAAVLFASMASFFSLSPEADAAAEAPLPAQGSAALLGYATDEGRAYTLSKRAVRAIARREAVRFGTRGARIVSMSPGLIDTAMSAGEENEHTRRMLAGAALPRMGAPEELADAAVYLCSPRASFVTGVDLRVDGGALAAMGMV